MAADPKAYAGSFGLFCCPGLDILFPPLKDYEYEFLFLNDVERSTFHFGITVYSPNFEKKTRNLNFFTLIFNELDDDDTTTSQSNKPYKDTC
jgi:hypothetical protein